MKTSLTTLLLLLTLQLSAQSQTDRTALVKTLLRHPEMQQLFAGMKAYYVLSTPACNPNICQTGNIGLDKPLIIYTREDFFMRNMEAPLEIMGITVKGDQATVNVLMRPGGNQVFLLRQKNGGWDWKSEVTPAGR